MSSLDPFQLKLLFGATFLASIAVPLTGYLHLRTIGRLKEESRRLREKISEEQAAVIQYHLPECPNNDNHYPGLSEGDAILHPYESIVTMRPLHLSEMYDETSRFASPLFVRYATESFATNTFTEGSGPIFF